MASGCEELADRHAASSTDLLTVYTVFTAPTLTAKQPRSFPIDPLGFRSVHRCASFVVCLLVLVTSELDRRTLRLLLTDSEQTLARFC